MDLLLTDDEAAIEKLGADVMRRHFGVEAAHRIAAHGSSPNDAGWASLVDSGWFGVSIDEAHGGGGLTPIADSLLYREAGKAIAPLGVLATTLAAHAVIAGGRVDLLEALLTGGMRAGLAITGLDSRSMTAIDPPPSGLVIVLEPRACTVHMVDETMWGDPVDLIDPATPARSFSPKDAPLVRLDGPASAPIDHLSRLLVASMLVGIAQESLAGAVSWSKEREAFGHPIGTYQAIKHRCADGAIHTEAADAQTMFAATAFAEGRPDAHVDIDAAYVVSLKAALAATGANVQVHGALGITWEHHAHLFITRSRVLEHLGTGVRLALRRVLEQSTVHG